MTATHVWLLSLVLSAGAVAAACTSEAQSTPSQPAVARPRLCGMLAEMHDARDAAAAALMSAQAGRRSDAVRDAQEARRSATRILQELPSVGAVSADDDVLREHLAAAGRNIDQVASIFAESDAPSDPDYLAHGGPAAMLLVDQTLGSAEAFARTGSTGNGGPCAGMALGSPLPTLPPVPSPTDGPVPPQTPEEQSASALAAVGLRRATTVELRAPDRVSWFPTSILLRDVSLTNHSETAVRFAVDVTPLRWNGRGWERMPCVNDDAAQPARTAEPLCGVSPLVTGTRLLPAASTLDDEALGHLAWPSAGAVPPGTYALIVPIWPGSEEHPRTSPKEAAIAILTISSSPR